MQSRLLRPCLRDGPNSPGRSVVRFAHSLALPLTYYIAVQLCLRERLQALRGQTTKKQHGKASAVHPAMHTAKQPDKQPSLPGDTQTCPEAGHNQLPPAFQKRHDSATSGTSQTPKPPPLK
jgi:hypothetical protein